MEEQGLVPVGNVNQLGYRDQLESTLISRMCEDPEEGAMIAYKLNGLKHFERFRDGFQLAKSMIISNKQVSMLGLRNLMKTRGYLDAEINAMFEIGFNNEETDYVVSELIRVATLQNAYRDLQEMQDKAIEELPIRKLSGEVISRATQWTLGAEKKIYTLGETLDEPADIREHLFTGVPLIDNEFFSEGGLRKGTLTGLISRQKHGKTRFGSWIDTRIAMQNKKVLYVAIEGTRQDISKNAEQILGELVLDYKNNLLLVEGVNDVNEILSLVSEAVIAYDAEAVVFDYFNIMEDYEFKGSSYNDKAHQIINKILNHCVNYNYAGFLMSQARKKTTGQGFSGGDQMPSGWSYQPTIHDAYGSQAMSNACAVILTAFRPNMVDGLTKEGYDNVNQRPIKKVMDFEGVSVPYTSFYVYMEANRHGSEYLHTYLHFVDSNRGLQFQRLMGV